MELNYQQREGFIIVLLSLGAIFSIFPVVILDDLTQSVTAVNLF